MPVIEGPFRASDVAAWDRTADVVVIGLGIAGSCAALAAQEAGADVLVLERAGAGGGASALSQGQFYLGGGTAVQTACGYADSPQEMYRFMRAVTTTDEEEKLRVFCDESVAQFDWLEAQGVPFARVAYKHKAVYTRTGEGLLTTGNEKAWPFREQAVPAPRGHQVSGDGDISGGNVAMKAILGTVEREHVPVIYEANVVGLVQDDDGRVVGVKMRKDGLDEFVEARQGRRARRRQLQPQRRHHRREHAPLRRVRQAAGRAHERRSRPAARANRGRRRARHAGPHRHGVDLSPRGPDQGHRRQRRTARASWPRTSTTAACPTHIARQPGAKAFLILDEEIFGYPKHGSHTFIDAFETVQEMEAALAVPAGSLSDTLDRYNADVAAGEDAQFHKGAEWLKVLNAPYAVFEISVPTLRLPLDVAGRARHRCRRSRTARRTAPRYRACMRPAPAPRTCRRTATSTRAA